MAKAVIPIPTMTGGISEQPEALRLPSQAQDSRNTVASVIEGLKKRPPTVDVGTVAIDATYHGVATKHHTINRDADERYHVMVKDQELQVFNLGTTTHDLQPIDIFNKKGSPVSGADWNYLETADPRNDLKLLTVADYTVVVNRSIPPALLASRSDESNPQGLFVIRQGNYSTLYTATVKWLGNTTTATYETYSSDGTPPGGGTKVVPDAEASIRGESIVAGLIDALTASTPSVIGAARPSGPTTNLNTTLDWIVTGKNGIIHIERRGDTEFTLEADDSVGSTSVTVVKDTVQLLSDLPLTAKDGMKVNVKGEADDSNPGYWVEFEADVPDISDGSWSESVAPGIPWEIDPQTMPHALIRDTDGSFCFMPFDGTTLRYMGGADIDVPAWGNRTVGDETTNPDPSFIGQNITSVFFWKNRLGLLAGDKVLLSEVGEFFNFWKTTTTDLLDTARIDVSAAHTKVTDVVAAVPMSEQLVVFSENSQFVLRGDGPLTPTNLSIAPTSEYDVDPGVTPVAVGPSIMAPVTRGNTSIIRELVDVSQNRPRFQAVDITAPTPTLITGTVGHITASASENMMAVTEGNSGDRMYVYTWFTNGGERVQAAWQRWDFGNLSIVRHAEFIDNELYVILERRSDVSTTFMSIEKVNIEAFIKEPAAAGDIPLIHLDRKVTSFENRTGEPGALTVVYDSNADTTTITLPYTKALQNTYVVTTLTGAILPEVSSTDTTIVVSGDHRSTDLVVGSQFTMEHTLSKPTLRDREGAPVATGTLRLRMANLLYQDSSWFQVNVTDTFGQVDHTSTWSAQTISGGAQIGVLNQKTGRYRFGVMGRADDLTVMLTSDSPWPCRFVSMDWECSYVDRGGPRL